MPSMRLISSTCLLLALLLPMPARAQTTAENLAKYDALRDRLRAELIIIGDGPGESMPSHIRHDGLGYIRWADATIDLGWYIGVLATEHRLLQSPSRFPGIAAARDLAQTEDELYYALAAMERLDRVANASFDPPCTQSEVLDGFFLRDDVPADFHTRFGLSSTRSDFIDPAITNKEMSQDQVWHVMMGLALVSELVPAGTTVRGRDLPAWALEQVERILGHVASMEWTIKNPACMDRNVARGPSAVAYALGATRAAEFLTDGRLTFPIDRFMTALWNSLTMPDNPAYSDVDNLHMAMVIAAVGRGFGRETIDHLATLADLQGWWVYPLLHVVLHGEEGAPTWCLHRNMVNAGARAMIDELPIGAEPSSPRPDRAAHQFTASNRFIRGQDQAYVGSAGSDGERYHGLDFMLLHNLYALATPTEWEGSDAPALGPCDPPPPPVDAGSTRDAGVGLDGGPGASGDGCGCRVVGGRGGSGLALLVIALGLAILRRRSNASGG